MHVLSYIQKIQIPGIRYGVDLYWESNFEVFLLFPRKNFSGYSLQNYLLLICAKPMVVRWQISWFFVDVKE